MRAWILAVIAGLAVVTTTIVGAQAPTGPSCTQPRIRKPWEAYTDAEKQLYVNAVGLAMKQGFHQKFVELHTEAASEAEAHRNCMFIYWHRMYLLGYENMLRSLGPGYECVTLPYWDHLSATARAASGTCRFMEDCSPIYRDLGGSTVGVDTNLIIYDTTIRDTRSTKCVTSAPLNNFCGNNTRCAGCVLRGRVSRTTYPAEATFASVYQQVFTYSDWPRFATTIERGVHNMVHSALGGIMAYFQSPIDPVFYTHHGIIDLLQTVYLKCQLGDETAVLTPDQKSQDPRFWSACARRNGTAFKPTDTITMMTRDFGRQWVHVRTNSNNLLYPFFKDVPARFVDYVDAKDMGAYSYTYQLQGALANMYNNCQEANTIAAATITLLSDEARTRRDNYAGARPLPVLDGSTKTDTKFRLWTIAVFESAKLAGYTDQAARDQMELMLCVHSDECLGGVQDYDSVFRANFGVTGHPRCYTLLAQLKAGKKVIGVPGWHDISSKFLSCPEPKRNADGTLHRHKADEKKGKDDNDDDNEDDDDDDDVGHAKYTQSGIVKKIRSWIKGKGKIDKGNSNKKNTGNGDADEGDADEGTSDKSYGDNGMILAEDFSAAAEQR